MDGIITEKIPVNRFFSKRITFHFGMYVWIAIAEKHEVWVGELNKVDPLELSVDALTFAAQWAEYKKGKKQTITHAKMRRWVNKIPAVQFERIQKAMLESRIGGDSIMNIVDKGKKKQAPRK